MRPKYITVRWTDHHEKDETWSEPTDPKDLKPCRVESRGWVISENDEVIEISSHRPLDKDDTSWGRPMRIVKSSIYYRSDKKPGKEDACESTLSSQTHTPTQTTTTNDLKL